jgi:hypothetical protein
MKFLTQGEVGEALQAIYDNELNVRIESSWDNGYIYYIGDHYNGYGDSYHPLSNRIEDVVSEICFRVAQLEPESDFAKYWAAKVNSIVTGKRPSALAAIEEAENLPAGYPTDFEPYVCTQEELDAMLNEVDQQSKTVGGSSIIDVNQFTESNQQN